MAIATQDGKNVNGHFGSANAFMIFDITEKGYVFVEKVVFGSDGTNACKDMKDMKDMKDKSMDRLSSRLKALDGSRIVFVSAIGNTASAYVIRNNVYPVRIDPPEEIEQVLSKVQSMLSGKTPIWLKRILGVFHK